MKVLFLNQVPEVNNKYTFLFAKSIQKEGIDVTVCGIEDDDVSSYNISYVNYFASYSKINRLHKKVISYYKSWKRIEKYCLENKVDVLHVQWYIFSPIDYYFHRRLKRKGLKIVATIHDLLPFNEKFYDFKFHKKIYQCADKIINQAKSNRKKLIDEFQVSEKQIHYIPHGHYMDYAEQVDFKVCRDYLNIPYDKKVILFFGQIKKVKGIDVLLEALHITIQSHNDVLCVIAGKLWKDNFDYYDEIIEDLNIGKYVQKHIRFINDDEIKYFFNATDIVALPYKQVYQSGVVLLSYAYEKPVIATAKGEFINVVTHKKTGLLVQADDKIEFAKAINWFLEHPQALKTFGKEGKAELSEKLSWTNIGKKMKAIYDIL